MASPRLPFAVLRQRRTTGALIAIIIALVGVLVALVIVALYLTQPRPLPGAPVSANPLYLYSIHGNADNPLLRPSSVAVAPDGRIIVADTGNARVTVFNAAGGYIESFTDAGPDDRRFISPTAVAVASDGRIFVVDVGLGGIIVLERNGDYRRAITLLQEVPIGVEVVSRSEGEESLYITTRSGVAVTSLDAEPLFTYLAFGAADGMFDTPTALVALPDAAPGQPDTVFVDSLNYRVQAFSSFETSPTLSWVYGTPLPPGSALRYSGDDRKFGLPVDIAANDRGEIFIVDGLSSQVVILDSRTGTFREFLGEQGRTEGTLYMPAGIDYRDGLIYIADKYNDRIEVFADPADPEVVQVERRVLKPEDLLWLLILVAAAEVITFGAIVAMRAPKLVFDLSAVEAVAAGEYGELIGQGLDRVYAAADTVIVAREVLPQVEFTVLEARAVRPEADASGAMAISGESTTEAGELDAFATAAVQLVAENRRSRVLVTASDAARASATRKKLQVVDLDSLIDGLNEASG